MVYCIHIVCFFKQKTAYEMSISDWSSDVCSSDLHMSDQTVQRIVIDGLVFHGDGNPEPLHTGRVTAASITVAPYTQGFEPAFDAMSRRPEERRVGQECVSPCRSRGALSNETKTGQKIY